MRHITGNLGLRDDNFLVLETTTTTEEQLGIILLQFVIRTISVIIFVRYKVCVEIGSIVKLKILIVRE